MPKAKERLMGKNRLLDLIAKRLYAYSLLRRVFREEPSKAMVELMLDDNLVEHFPFQEESKLIKEGVDAISFYLRSPDILTREGLEELIVDFSCLLEAPGKRFVPPWESVHRSKKRLVFQTETIAVRVAYAKQGLLPERFQLEPDDHIGLELEFMASLSNWILKALRKNELKKAARYIKAQKGFLEEHLLGWIPEFGEKFEANAETGFYKGAAKLLIGLVNLEKETLNELDRQIKLRFKQARAKSQESKPQLASA